MSKTNLNPDEMNNRYRRLNYKVSRTKSFGSIQVILIAIIVSPIFVLFGGLFLAIFLNANNIQIDLFPLFIAYIIAYISIIAILIIVAFIGLAMLIIITLTAYRRTHYNGYLYEALIELQLALLPFLGLLILFVLKTPSLYILYLIPILVPLEYKFIKKPLIYSSNAAFWPFSVNSINQESSDILIKQSMFIDKFEDGYSSRPVFEDISELFTSMTKEVSQSKLQKFAKFLAINGDLVAYDIDDNKLHLYLRTVFLTKTQVYNIFTSFKKIRQFIKKDGLTSITINLDSLEMNFKLNKYDYDMFDNITFLDLNQRILSQFKESIKEFLEGNYLESYEYINPKATSKKSLFLQNKVVGFLFIAYLTGIVIFGPLMYIWLGPTVQINSSGFGITFIAWPFFLFFSISSLNTKYNGNIWLILSKELSTLLIILFSSLIVLLISLTVFYLIYKHEKKSILNINREIKLVQ